MLRCIVVASAVTLVAAPASADDNAEKTGIIAGLGLAAADGKTTLSDGAGAIEAALLASKAIDDAAGKIVTIATGGAPAGAILVVGKADQTNLIVVTMVRRRIAAMTAALKARKCPDTRYMAGLAAIGSDPVALVITSTNYAAIPLSLDDRLLLSAVAARDKRFVLPSEIAAVDPASRLLADYDAMLKDADRLRRCSETEADKALIAAAQELAAALDKSEGTAPSALIAAAQLDRLLPRDAKSPAPSVLRLAIEQQGGTAITRSNIWYTLGFPGAAKISAGLIASYRLVGAATGQVLQAGSVLCAVAPVDISVVAKVALDGSGTSRQQIRCQPFPALPSQP